MTDNDTKLKFSNKKKEISNVLDSHKKIKQVCKTVEDINYIKRVVKILKDNNLAEIKYGTDHSEIKIVSNQCNSQCNSPQVVSTSQIVVPSIPNQSAVSPHVIAAPAAMVAPSAMATPPAVLQSVDVTKQQTTTTSEPDYKNHPGAIKSPMVGTCYLSPGPNTPTFVKIGDAVKKGQPLLIIEAMKVMNYIKASTDGKVVHIAVEDAQPIEFGQLLMVIE